jgi:hypothetical protein
VSRPTTIVRARPLTSVVAGALLASACGNPTPPSRTVIVPPPGIHCPAAPSPGISVFVSTLPPEIAGDINAESANMIAPFNARLVPAATAAGPRIVDLNEDLSMDVADWISPFDGLHPTEAGYQEIARVWAGVIQSTFELPLFSAATTNSSSPVRLKNVIRGDAKR